MTSETGEVKRSSATGPIDRELGVAVRQARKLARVSREAMADHLGVSVATIQKFENGTTRIPAVRLWLVAGLLQVDVASLFPYRPTNILANAGFSEVGSNFNHEHDRAAAMADLAKAAGKLSTERLILAVRLVQSLSE